MNSRAVSLPDLITEKRRNTAMSLSEGFPGFNREPALAATSQGFIPYKPEDSHARVNLVKVLPIYYRTREFIRMAEKSGRRVPQKLLAEEKVQLQAVTNSIRPLNMLLFQRFDELQLDRLLRGMPILRLSQGRWIFGGENEADWGRTHGHCVFLLLSGKVGLYPEPSGAGEKREVREGALFGEQRFRLGEELMQSIVACSARCEEPCIVGMLDTQVLEIAYTDRAFGNKRIAQVLRGVKDLERAVRDERELHNLEPDKNSSSPGKAVTETGAIFWGLRDMAQIATAVHVVSGQEVLSDEPLEDNMLVVVQGSLEVRGDVHLTERLENLPPRKVRIRVFVERAERLAGDSIFDKLDPYCIVKLGDFSRCQTPVLWNVGVNPKWDYQGVLKYSGEKELEFTVNDYDRHSADDLCGNGVLPLEGVEDGTRWEVDLFRPKRGIFKSEQTLEEPAGKLYVTIRWDFEKITALVRTPKEKTFHDQVLFDLKEQDCWGHENLVLGPLFERTLEQASSGMRYALSLGKMRVVATVFKGITENCTCWKISRKRFLEFIKQCSREKQFMQGCRLSVLEKQTHVKGLLHRLIKRWEEEEMSRLLRGGVLEQAVDEALEPSQFRVAYRDCKAHIIVRNALNLTGGSWFDKLDPFCVLQFRGSKGPPFRTSVLQDAGSDPVWDCEGALVYQGETTLDIWVYDYDRISAHDLIAVGNLPVERFSGGFEGQVPLSLPEGKKKRGHMKQMMIVLSVQWDSPKDPSLTRKSMSTTMRSLASPGGAMVAAY